MGVIHVDGLCKSYGAVDAVDGMAFTVDRGELYGFLGPNGAGKTTTIRVLTGQIEPDTGVGTNSDGITYPRLPYSKDFVNGIQNYDGEYDYTPGNTVVGRRSERKDQIDSGNPCLLSHWWKDTFDIDLDKDHFDNPEDFVELPVGHSETVFEYEEDDSPWWNPTEPTMYVSTYDTYGDVDEFTLKSSSVKFLVQTIEP